jgi:hypothetical protein
MFRLMIAKMVALVAILTFGTSVYYGYLMPFCLIGALILYFISQAIESQVYDIRSPTLRGTIGSILLFLITFRLSFTLKGMGLNLNELIYKDPVSFWGICVGITIYFIVDISYKSKRVRCTGIKTRLKGLGTDKRLMQRWDI